MQCHRSIVKGFFNKFFVKRFVFNNFNINLIRCSYVSLSYSYMNLKYHQYEWVFIHGMVFDLLFLSVNHATNLKFQQIPYTYCRYFVCASLSEVPHSKFVLPWINFIYAQMNEFIGWIPNDFRRSTLRLTKDQRQKYNFHILLKNLQGVTKVKMCNSYLFILEGKEKVYWHLMHKKTLNWIKQSIYILSNVYGCCRNSFWWSFSRLIADKV